VSLAALSAALMDRYRIERELGQGGMATVYLAHDVRHDRKVALKVLRPELSAILGAERFLAEIKTTANLQHPHILSLFDSGEAAGTLFYVMPLVTGESLRDRLLRESQLPIDEALQIVRDVAGALAYAHSRGIVHRDIKPENILLSAGQAVVADFGIAAVLGAVGSSKLTSTGMSIGTPDYMSPEQASGSPVDARSDVYSLGCVLYELLAGTPPFAGPNAQAVVARHLTDPVPSIRTVRRTVPATLERVVMTSLAKVPADRFASAAEFAAALPRHVDLLEPEPESPARVRPSRRWGRTVGISGSGLAAVLLIGGIAWFRSLSSGSGAIRSLAVMPFSNLTGDTAQTYLAVSATEQVVNGLVGLSALRVIQLDGSLTPEATDRLLKDNGVDAVLGGSVARSGDTVRISTQLRSVKTGQALAGGGSYRGVMTGILALQDSVSRSVADSIRVSMTPRERAQLQAARRAVSPEAYDAYARGLFFFGRLTGPDIRRSIAFYQRAIAVDSLYAEAWAGLAQSLQLSAYFGLVPPAEANPAARDAALKAIALDSMLPEPYTTLGRVAYLFSWDFASAERYHQRAIALRPGSARLHQAYSNFLSGMGRRAESIAEARLSVELDPASIIVSAIAARPYYDARQYDLAIAQSLRTLELDSNFSRARYWLGLSYAQTSRLPDAIRELERAVALAPIPLNEAALGHAYGRAGEREKALAILRSLLDRGRTSYVSSFDIATVYAGLGDRQRTLDWLERAYEGRASYLFYINVNPHFDAYRDDPRFRDLVRRIGLPAGS